MSYDWENENFERLFNAISDFGKDLTFNSGFKTLLPCQKCGVYFQMDAEQCGLQLCDRCRENSQ